MKYAVQLLVVIVLCSAVFYVVKALDSSDAYTTHSHTYAWFWTLAYTRGRFPAGMLVMIWVVVISACFHRIVLVSKRNGGSCLQAEPNDDGPNTTFRSHALSVSFAYFLNACVTLTVNTLYIYSTQQDLGSSTNFGIQLSLSVFRLVYIVVAFPLLPQSIRNPVQNIHFQFILLTINNLIIPCLVTALTSDACFQVGMHAYCPHLLAILQFS